MAAGNSVSWVGGVRRISKLSPFRRTGGSATRPSAGAGASCSPGPWTRAACASLPCRIRATAPTEWIGSSRVPHASRPPGASTGGATFAGRTTFPRGCAARAACRDLASLRVVGGAPAGRESDEPKGQNREQ